MLLVIFIYSLIFIMAQSTIQYIKTKETADYTRVRVIPHLQAECCMASHCVSRDATSGDDVLMTNDVLMTYSVMAYDVLMRHITRGRVAYDTYHAIIQHYVTQGRCVGENCDL